MSFEINPNKFVEQAKKFDDWTNDAENQNKALNSNFDDIPVFKIEGLTQSTYDSDIYNFSQSYIDIYDNGEKDGVWNRDEFIKMATGGLSLSEQLATDAQSYVSELYTDDMFDNGDGIIDNAERAAAQAYREERAKEYEEENKESYEQLYNQLYDTLNIDGNDGISAAEFATMLKLADSLDDNGADGQIDFATYQGLTSLSPDDASYEMLQELRKSELDSTFKDAAPTNTINTVFKDDERLKEDENGNKYVTVEAWGSAKNGNDCLSRIIKNNYDLKAMGMTYQEVEKAVMDANPTIYGTESGGGRNRILDGSRHNSVLHTGDKIILPQLQASTPVGTQPTDTQATTPTGTPESAAPTGAPESAAPTGDPEVAAQTGSTEIPAQGIYTITCEDGTRITYSNGIMSSKTTPDGLKRTLYDENGNETATIQTVLDAEGKITQEITTTTEYGSYYPTVPSGQDYSKLAPQNGTSHVKVKTYDRNEDITIIEEYDINSSGVKIANSEQEFVAIPDPNGVQDDEIMTKADYDAMKNPNNDVGTNTVNTPPVEETKEPLPSGVTDTPTHRKYYDDALAYPSDTLTKEDFWNSDISNLGKLEIVKAAIEKNNIIDPSVLNTIQSHCSEIYLNVLNNATTVYMAERAEELRGSLTESSISLIKLDRKQEMDAIIKMYQNIKDNYMRQGGMGNVTSQFKSLQRLAHFNLSYVADLIQEDSGKTETANLEKLANIIHNSSTINNDTKQKAEDWFHKNTKWDDYDSEPRNKKLEIILKDTTLSRGEKYYLINKYCYDTTKKVTFIHDITDKFRYKGNRSDEEFKIYNANYVDEFLSVLSGI